MKLRIPQPAPNVPELGGFFTAINAQGEYVAIAPQEIVAKVVATQ
jgi:hypothetical protein